MIFPDQIFDSYKYEVLSHSDPNYDTSKDENKFITIDDPNDGPMLVSQ